MMKPEVSVIIPAYNCEKTIEKAIHSALDQFDVHIELIIINDCSTDKTSEVIENLSKTDARIKFYSNNQNLGVAQTRNIGCNHAQGNYIAFLDSDDFWESDKLATQLKEMRERKSDFSFTSYYVITDETQGIFKTYQAPNSITYCQLLKENVIGCSTVVISSNLMRKYSFSPTFSHEDYVLWLQILKSENRAIGITKPLTFYYLGGRSSNKLKAAKNRWIIYRKAEKLPFFKSLYYMIQYTWNGLNKYGRKNTIKKSSKF